MQGLVYNSISQLMKEEITWGEAKTNTDVGVSCFQHGRVWRCIDLIEASERNLLVV
jgi:hypothetical protein